MGDTDIHWRSLELYEYRCDGRSLCGQFGSYYGSTFFEYFKHVATPYSKGEYFEVAYWVMFVVAFSPYIFVIAIRIMIYMYGIRRGADSAASVVERYQDNIYSILWFLVNTLYFPVITMMLAGTSCTFSNTSTDGSNIPPTLDANNSIICLQGKHIGFLVCTMIALIIYYPAASFAQSQTQNISDIKFKPKVVFVMLQGKFVMGAICVAFANNKYWAYISTAVLRAKFRNNAGDKSSSQVNSPQGASQNEQELDEIPSIHQPQYNNNNSKTTSNQSTPPPPATTTTTINSNNNISEDSSSSDES
ncbi:hypothetical protein PPL_07383 [Heterostelium album PN500]|uniref:Transmembrane protein n=1 Tax=Heterostelium pallidum (strain ATCC 26659 / Pp 5 / PN500) TaxID=670386 RepID=D3BFT2_HETP5|nr:hypothetical protein PPL_07383 [Heterostelium album PN500]EFA79692.1 hypothetical protein PPL_07383 [Heterostelium album PN500]|eukprot:XP_020431813.1 hypothetical protein PPL_07383 [Heterostelium album PN500]